MIIVLDSGPLGLLSNPRPRGPAHDAWDWARTHVAAGAELVLPEIADYEVRRELVRSGRDVGIARLDELCAHLSYVPLTTPVMRDAAGLWAEARNGGYPTAHQAALDGDVLLAAQARSVVAAEPAEWVVVATMNVAHLERFVEAKHWADI